MEWLIITIVLIGLVGLLVGMSKDDRAKVAGATTVVTGSLVVYTYKWGKKLTRGAYDLGVGVGNDVHNNYQDELDVMDKWAKEAKAKGIKKTAITTANEHMDTLGIKGIVDLAREYKDSTTRK